MCRYVHIRTYVAHRSAMAAKNTVRNLSLKQLAVEKPSLSQYASSLPAEELARYIKKVSVVAMDPYLVKESDKSHEIQHLPDLNSMDIMAYLISTSSPYTANNFQAYKSSEAYNQFANGWLFDTCVYIPPNNPGLRVVFGQVMHSQAIREKALRPWVIATSGRIHSAHCNCKAGLGEVCTHIATLLFGIDAGVRVREKMTVTQVKAYWMDPKRKQVAAAPIGNIDFSSAAKRKRRLDAAIDGLAQDTHPLQNPHVASASCPATEVMNDTDLKELILGLSRCSPKSAVLSAIDHFVDSFIPPEIMKPFPPILTDLTDPATFDMSFADLLKHCDGITYDVTQEAANNVELYTRKQAKSNLWFRYRAGRITASKLSQVCRTDRGAPAISLIKSVCYPDLYKFNTEATTWGCEHEEHARKVYEREMNKKHSGFCVTDSGFMVNPKYPHLGASPDGLTMCLETCCGKERLGVCEIKCPFCKKDMVLRDAAEDKGFCLEEVNGELRLSREHSYFFQVQAQIYVSGRAYCDFVVWTKNDVYIERVTGDNAFWADAVVAATHFFKVGILPELVGKHFTSAPKDMTQIVSGNGDDKWCYCQVDCGDGKMILCENSACSIRWFHFTCLGLPVTYYAQKKWYCPDCRLLSKFQKNAKK